jgi:putative transposon-encoded protein
MVRLTKKRNKDNKIKKKNLVLKAEVEIKQKK